MSELLVKFDNYCMLSRAMTQHLKCDYSVTPENFCAKFLNACVGELCSLMCCFSVKLLYVYETGITPNFKFEFYNCTSLLVEQLLPNLLKKNLKFSSVKLTRKHVRGLATKHTRCRAIAGKTAQCALCMGAIIIFERP